MDVHAICPYLSEILDVDGVDELGEVLHLLVEARHMPHQPAFLVCVFCKQACFR